MNDVEAMATEVADRLRGTCSSLQVGIASVLGKDALGLKDDPVFCMALDDAVFCCEQCGWWRGTEDVPAGTPGGFLCRQCEDLGE